MIKRVVLLLLFICLCNCEELIEVEDISNEEVTVLAPVDNTILETNVVNFSWQTLEFAETYHLQVAKPSFVAAQEIVLDTIISSSNFTKILESNPYQWRIKAKNSAYETQFSTQNLIIED
jgi:hypothetical protein